MGLGSGEQLDLVEAKCDHAWIPLTSAPHQQLSCSGGAQNKCANRRGRRPSGRIQSQWDSGWLWFYRGWIFFIWWEEEGDGWCPGRGLVQGSRWVWKYLGKRRVNFDLKAMSVGGGGRTQQELSGSGAPGILLWWSR